MVNDPIVEEIRAIRRELAAKFDNDIYRIGEDVRRRDAASGRPTVSLPKRTPVVPAATNPAPCPNCGFVPTAGQPTPAAG